MRILFISTVLPSSVAPTRGTFNRVLLDSLAALGHEVRAIVPVPWHEAGLRRLRAGTDTTECRFWYPPGILASRLHRFLGPSIGRAVRRATGGWRPDVVVGYWTHPDGTVARSVADTLGVPMVLVTGGTDVNLLAEEPGRRDVIVGTLRSADHVVAIGSGLAERVKGFGVPAGRVTVFRRGVDIARFHRGSRQEARRLLGIPETERMLLWVGRMVPVKGLPTLIEALADPGIPESATLYLVGSGPLESELARRAGELGVTGRVRFVGPVGHSMLGDWYRAADIVVLPSLSEGTPNVLLEALACGTPFVASAVGSIPDLAESGEWLTPPGDSASLAAAIGRMIGNPPAVAAQPVDDLGAAQQFAGVLTETASQHANTTARISPRPVSTTSHPGKQRDAG